MKGRLFIVSNRMPVTIENFNGKSQVRQSSGGLISAISGYLNGNGQDDFSKVFWAGIPDVNEKYGKNMLAFRRLHSITYLFLSVSDCMSNIIADFPTQ